MSKNFDFLLTNIPKYYKNKILSDGFVSKIFTFLNNHHQIIFINEWEQIKGGLESDFCKFLVKKYNADCYSRGSLFVNEKEEQTMSLIFIDKTNDEGIEKIASVQRDNTNKIISIGEFKTYTSKKKDIIFGWLYDDSEFTPDQLNLFNNLHDEIKDHFIIRDLSSN